MDLASANPGISFGARKFKKSHMTGPRPLYAGTWYSLSVYKTWSL